MIEKIKTVTACVILLFSVMLFSFLLENEPKHSGAGLLSPIAAKVKNVNDTEPPTIEMKRTAFLDVKNYDELKKLFRVKDNMSDNIKIDIEGDVNFNKNGFYVINVTVSDESGNVATKDFGIQIYTNLLIITENTKKPKEFDYSIYENNTSYDTYGEVKSITLSKHELALYDNSKTTKITANITPENLSNKPITWSSSNSNVAIVSSDGYVTPVSAGTTIITASVDNVKDTCKVTVIKSVIKVTSVTLNESTINLNTNSKAHQLTATVLPKNATNKTVTWKSDNKSVATVSSKGLVTPIGIGRATITAEADGIIATCTVNVSKAPVLVTSVELDKKTLNLVEGQKDRLVLSITPGDADNKATTWSSSNNNIVTVDKNGQVTAKSAGKATITAAAGGKKATCTVTVSKYENSEVDKEMGSPGVNETAPAEDKTVKVSLITIDRQSVTLITGNTVVLTATINPSNATNKGITWKSSNTGIATVNSSGVVTAKSAGTATITATADGKTASCNIIVNNKEQETSTVPKDEVISVVSVQLNNKVLNLSKGSTKALAVTINPKSATNTEAKWYTSNSFVATVNDKGVIKAMGAGSATITVIVDGKRDTCEVEVTNTICSGSYETEERTVLLSSEPFKYGTKKITYQREVVYKYSSGCERIVYSSIDTTFDKSGYNATTQDLIPEAREVIQQNTEVINTVLRKTNEYRIEANNKKIDGVNNRSQLVLDNKLNLAATVRALEMAYSGVFEHTRPNGTKWSTAILECGGTRGFLGENIAKGYANAESVSNGWKTSASHYENLIRPGFNRIGIGYYDLNGTTYWAQEFNSKE